MKLNKYLVSAGIGCTNILASIAMASTAGGNSATSTANQIQPTHKELPPEVIELVNTILGYAQAAGVVIAIGMLTYAGFKYLMAGAGEKAKAKDMFVPLAVGAGLVMLAPFIGQTIWNALSTAK